MLREQVCTLANHQTNGEVSENSSTESSERLENLYKLYRPKHGESWQKNTKKFIFLQDIACYLVDKENKLQIQVFIGFRKKVFFFFFCCASVESIHYDNTVSSDEILGTLSKIYPHQFSLTFTVLF